MAKLRRQQGTATEGDDSILSAAVTERGNGSLASRVTERGNELLADVKERGNGERPAHVTERGNGSLAPRVTERGNKLLADVKERGNDERSAHVNERGKGLSDVTERGNGKQSALSSSVLSSRGGGNARVKFQVAERAAAPETAGALFQNSYSDDDRMRNSFQYHTPASLHRKQLGTSFGSSTEADRPRREDQPIREEHKETLTNYSSRRPFSPDLERILKRVHNLELLAAQGESRTEKSSIPVRNEEPDEKMAQDVVGGGDRDVYSADLERAVQRIETIEADFEVLHQKYRSLGGTRASPGNVERREVEGLNNGQISRELIVEIEQEILAELLNSELWYS